MPGEALRIPSRKFLEILKANPRAHRLVLQYSYTLFHQAARAAACDLFHSIKHRCAKWLLMTWERVGKAEFSLTHEFLAEMLGSRRAGVSRAAFQLRAAGLIDYRNGKMRIRDVDGLKKVSCECFLIIQKEATQSLPSRRRLASPARPDLRHVVEAAVRIRPGRAGGSCAPTRTRAASRKRRRSVAVGSRQGACVWIQSPRLGHDDEDATEGTLGEVAHRNCLRGFSRDLSTIATA